MEKLTGKERIKRILSHQPVDRIGVYEHFWDDTKNHYIQKNYLHDHEILETHFNLDIMEAWVTNFIADMDFENIVVAETEDTKTVKDGSGATLKWHKKHNTTPEHIAFDIKCFEDWKRIRHFYTELDERRINFEGYRQIRAIAKENEKFFTWSTVNVFEIMHPICGHEHILFGMADDPDWILDMAEVFSDLLIKIQQTLFEKEGYPDGIWYYEDMGYKQTPFMSPAMYRELLMPAHKKTIDYAHSVGLPVIMHSCGFVEPLLPHMVEAGIDCLQAIEIKAGMDLNRIYKNFGDKIALMGGIDVRALYSNDKEKIDKELESKVPVVKEGYGFILHSDHSIPYNVNYETLKYFIDKGIALGTYES